MKRRDFIRFGLGTFGVCACGVANGFSFDRARGCRLTTGDLNKVVQDRNFLSLSKKPIIASGNPDFDQALGRQLVRLSRSFRVDPGFGYVNSAGGGAYASHESFEDMPNTKGTVIFGLDLLQKILGMGEGGDIAVLGVCAHEFAHIYQFFSPANYEITLRSRHPTVKLLELHADYMAGYFIRGLKEERTGIVLQAFGKFFYSMGDTNFNDKDHHGTPDERIRATEAGYKAAPSVSSADGAARQGFEFVVRSFS